MTITRVQGNARGTTSGSSISVTMASAPTQGNVLVACIGASDYSGFPTVTGISQTGVSWSKVVSKSYNDGLSDLENSEIWVGTVNSGALGSLTVSLSRSAPEGGICDVCEYSGLTTTVDKTATNCGSGTQPDTGTTATTTQAAELWIGAATSYEATQSTASNGFTLLDGALMSGVPYPISLSYLEKIVSATGNANSTLGNETWAGWTGCIATFKGQTTPQYTLSISAVTGGTTNPSAGNYSYDQGSNVQVTANQNSGYRFDHWVLDGSSYTSNPITVTMNNNHSLQPFFVQTYTLTITTGTGGYASPTGSQQYDAGTNAQVTAYAYSGYDFNRWTLDGTNAGYNSPITVTMNANHALYAAFSSSARPANQSNFTRIRVNGSTYALCAVPDGSGAQGMGGTPKIRRNGVTYNLYLVSPNNAFASPVRIRTSTQTAAIRYYTQHNNSSGYNDHTNIPHDDAPFSTTSHTDTPHNNSDFNNSDFGNTPHNNSDNPFSDSPFNNTPFNNAPFNNSVHSDILPSGHNNTPYTDTYFSNTPFSNTAHSNTNHGNVGHADTQHSNTTARTPVHTNSTSSSPLFYSGYGYGFIDYTDNTTDVTNSTVQVLPYHINYSAPTYYYSDFTNGFSRLDYGDSSIPHVDTTNFNIGHGNHTNYATHSNTNHSNGLHNNSSFSNAPFNNTPFSNTGHLNTTHLDTPHNNAFSNVPPMDFENKPTF